MEKSLREYPQLIPVLLNCMQPFGQADNRATKTTLGTLATNTTGVTLLFTHSPPMGKSLQDKPQPRQVLFMRLSGRETIGQQKPTSEQ